MSSADAAKSPPGLSPPHAEPIKFTLRGTPLLSQGATTTPKAAAANLWVHAKVYADGGENELHAHPDEDHTFFVLQGAAVFQFGDGREITVESFDGVLLPKGTLYKFHAVGNENLVMLRVGAAQRGDDWCGEIVQGVPREIRHAVDANGQSVFGATSKKRSGAPAQTVVESGGRFPALLGASRNETT